MHDGTAKQIDSTTPILHTTSFDLRTNAITHYQHISLAHLNLVHNLTSRIPKGKKAKSATR